ncbi:MAG: hypothetical protein LBF42_02545 [Puniceicoccales bacterium]|jgi:hypothetical protein|nr:hypothetical protein [Puniceicoccales bacterium]
MKKLTAIVASLLGLGCLKAFEMPALGVDTSVKFSTQNVVRGHRQGNGMFYPKTELVIPMFSGRSVRLGTCASLGLKANAIGLGLKGDVEGLGSRNEVNPYGEVTYEVGDMFTVGAGYVHHLYTNVPESLKAGMGKQSKEIYSDVKADVFLSPLIRASYDFDAKEIDVEGQVAYNLDLEQFGLDGVSVELGAVLGWDKANRPWAISKTWANKLKREGIGLSGYFYYGTSVDGIYDLNENTRVSAGVEIAGGIAKKDHWVKKSSNNKCVLVWFNTSIDCSF